MSGKARAKITVEYLADILMVPWGGRIVGAEMHDDIVTLTIEHPSLPDGTHDISPTYMRVVADWGLMGKVSR